MTSEKAVLTAVTGDTDTDTTANGSTGGEEESETTENDRTGSDLEEMTGGIEVAAILSATQDTTRTKGAPLEMTTARPIVEVAAEMMEGGRGKMDRALLTEGRRPQKEL